MKPLKNGEPEILCSHQGFCIQTSSLSCVCINSTKSGIRSHIVHKDTQTGILIKKPCFLLLVVTSEKSNGVLRLSVMSP